MNNQQKYMAQLAIEQNQMLAERFAERLNADLFPDPLSISWYGYVRQAILHTPPYALKVSILEFNTVIKKLVELGNISEEPKLTLYQFGVLSNCIETVAATDLGLLDNVEGYYNFIEEAGAHMKTYAKIIGDIRKELETSVAQEFQQKIAEQQATNGKNKLQPVKAEA